MADVQGLQATAQAKGYLVVVDAGILIEGVRFLLPRKSVRFSEMGIAVNFAVECGGGDCQLALEAVLGVSGHVSLIIAY